MKNILVFSLLIALVTFGCKEISQSAQVQQGEPEQLPQSDPVQGNLDDGYEALENSDFAKAISEWEALPKDSEKYKAVRTDLGYAYFRDGNFDQAVKLLAPIVNDSKDPYRPKAQWHLAQVYYAQQDFTSCTSMLGDALQNEAHPFKLEIEQMLNRLEN